mgnify:CR=1 FL=1
MIQVQIIISDEEKAHKAIKWYASFKDGFTVTPEERVDSLAGLDAKVQDMLTPFIEKEGAYVTIKVSDKGKTRYFGIEQGYMVCTLLKDLIKHVESI